MSELTNIQILRSAVPYKRPDPSFLLDGQLALNYKAEEPGLFAKLQDGGMFKIGPSAYTTTGDFPNKNPGVGGVAGNLVGEEWIDGRNTFHSPIKKFWNGTAWETVNGFTVDNATGFLTCMKTINVDFLNCNSLHSDGTTSINGDILPDGTSGVWDIGKSSERWRNIFCDELDMTGDLSLGDDLSVGGSATIGDELSVGGNLFVNGEATFGQSCSQGKFTVKMPSFFNCDVSVSGDVSARDLNLTGGLNVEGDLDFGSGCGKSTTNFYSDVIFHCDVQFVTFPLEFEKIEITDDLTSLGDTTIGTSCASSELTVNALSTFNCQTTFEAETRIGLRTQSAFRTFGDNVFNKDLQCNSDLQLLTGKGYSLHTSNTDPDNTMVTKKWSEEMALSVVSGQAVWNKNGTFVSTNEANVTIIPNGTQDFGTTSLRWKSGYFNDVYTNDLHLKNDRGDWTMIEEEEVLTLRNNKTGKRYAISMTPYPG